MARVSSIFSPLFSELRLKMRVRSSHLWINIHAGYYDFLQREKDAVIVATLTKSSLLEFYTTYFFDTPSHRIRRLSAHVKSQRLQPEACAALGPAFMALNLPVDQAAMGAFIASKPTLAILKGFAGQYLTAHGKTVEEVQKFLQSVEGLVEVPIAEGATLVTDKNAFRKSAVPAPYAVPVEEYSDLFPAKM